MLDEALLRDFDVSLSVYNLLDEALLRDFRVGLGLGIVFSEALAFFSPFKSQCSDGTKRHRFDPQCSVCTR